MRGVQQQTTIVRHSIVILLVLVFQKNIGRVAIWARLTENPSWSGSSATATPAPSTASQSPGAPVSVAAPSSVQKARSTTDRSATRFGTWFSCATASAARRENDFRS